jgi:transposase-like protein
VSQSNAAQSPETRSQETRTFIRQVRAASRRKYTPEEKIRIVLEGFRREVAVSDLCRREGIRPGTFYAWTKEFMEAGKERLTRDSIRDATRQERDWWLTSLWRSTGSKKRPFPPWKTPAYEPPGRSTFSGGEDGQR